MSLWVGFERALPYSWSVRVVLLGQGTGLLFTKTLHCLRALRTLNYTMPPKPSSCRDSVAREYSALAIVLAVRFPCLNAR